MAIGSCTIPNMKNPNDKPKGRKRSWTAFLRISPELGEAFEEYLRQTRPAPTMTNAFEAALEDFLRAQGFWPGKEKKK